MNRSQKLLLLASLSCALGFGVSQSVNATDIDVDATMTASVAVTVVKNSDIDFGGIDFVPVHNGTVELGPDGNAATGGGSNGLTLTGTPTAGELAVTGNGSVLEITCDATGVIGDGSTDLNITTVVWDTSNAAAYGAAANTCAGLGLGVQTIDTGVTANPVIYVGAELTIGANALATSSGSTPFDTSTGGGDPITFRFVYQ